MGNSHNSKRVEKNSKEINKFYLSPDYLPTSEESVQRNLRKQNHPVVVVIPEMFYGNPAPCTYIRLFAPLLTPAFNSAFEVRIATLKSAVSIAADAVIINRVPCEHVSELHGILCHLRKTGAKLIYDIDDQLLDFADSHPEAREYTDRQAVVKELLSAADSVWVSTKQLAKALSPMCKKIEVFENYLDLNLWEGEKKPRPLSSDGRKKFNIIYMGSATHAADLELVINALIQLHTDGEEFDLYLIGISTNAPQYSWIKVIHPPAQAGNNNYPEFMRWLRSMNMFDLGIAPLEENQFNRCKSAIKYWDYSSLGIPTLASNVVAYNTIVVDGENGFLANNNTEDWYKKLRTAMKNTDQLGSIVANAKGTLKKLYAQLNGTVRRKQAVTSLLGPNQDDKEVEQYAPLGDSPTREAIAAAFLSGDGIEIGALHNPLAIPPCAKAKYVDRMPKEKLYEHYPELRTLPLVDVDIVDDGELLITVADNSQDFVIANHFLEHSEDPVITLKNLLRVVKTGGVVYLAVPNMTKTFDCNRVETTLAHIISDHKLGAETSRRKHYEEWVSLVEPHFGRTYDGIAFDRRVEEIMGQKYSIHFHCWSVSGFKNFLNYLQDDCALPIDILLFADRGDEYVTILKKKQLA